MDEPLRLEYACTPEERSEAESLQIREQLGGSKWVSMAVLIIVFLAVLAALFGKACEIYPGHPAQCVIGSLLSFGIVFTFVIFLNKRKGSSPIVAEISTDSIKINTSTGQALLPWKAFDKLYESETLFVLRSSAHGAVYIFPKRAFSDTASREWFRTTGNTAISTGGHERTEAPSFQAAASPDSIVLQFKLAYRDYVDRTFASWRYRGVMCFLAGALLISAFIASFNRPPDAYMSTTAMWCFFLVFIAAGACVGLFVVTTQMWLAHRQSLTLQKVTITERGYMTESSFGRGAVSWEQPTRFKETQQSFIIWHPGTPAWMLLPKKAFPSTATIDTCRKILSKHATRSTWFF